MLPNTVAQLLIFRDLKECRVWTIPSSVRVSNVPSQPMHWHSPLAFVYFGVEPVAIARFKLFVSVPCATDAGVTRDD